MGIEYAPGITEEQMADIQRFHEMADEIFKNQEDRPAGYFKGDRHAGDGIECFPPGVKPSETPYARLRRIGKIPY
ncbi:MAG: hypothetical protein H7833_15500 [Magnetococcus sp. DMHC-1]|nr:hypothetical protein [Magnetococcales bacterium]